MAKRKRKNEPQEQSLPRRTRSAILTELDRICSAHRGVLRPQDVVEYARDEETALHDQFEWDDTIAGEAYRLTQARAIIRAQVRVIATGTAPTRVFVSLVEERSETGPYRRTVDVMSNADHRMELLAQAKRELEQWQERYRHLEELASIFAAIRGVA